MAGAQCACFDDGAHLVFAQSLRGAIVLTGIHASEQTRGRDMLAWLRSHYGRQLHVYDVAYSAAGFWARMEDEGLVARWSLNGPPARTVAPTVSRKAAGHRGECERDLGASDSLAPGM
jgi:hypothetical protein